MSQFKVNDLMIDVVSDEVEKLRDLCRYPTKYCPTHTLNCRRDTFINCPQTTRVGCNFLTRCIAGTLDCPAISKDPCGANYSGCFMSDFFVLDLERLVINPADVRVVREQLDEVFRAVEVRSAEVSEQMQPRTREQAEFLEERLTAALEQVRAMKERLG